MLLQAKEEIRLPTIIKSIEFWQGNHIGVFVPRSAARVMLVSESPERSTVTTSRAPKRKNTMLIRMRNHNLSC